MEAGSAEATPAVAFHCRYFESAIGRDKPIPGHWWPCHRWRVSQPTASGRNTLEYYAQTLAELDATSFAYGGYSVLTMGHEVEVLAGHVDGARGRRLPVFDMRGDGVGEQQRPAVVYVADASSGPEQPRRKSGSKRVGENDGDRSGAVGVGAA